MFERSFHVHDEYPLPQVFSLIVSKIARLIRKAGNKSYEFDDCEMKGILRY